MRAILPPLLLLTVALTGCASGSAVDIPPSASHPSHSDPAAPAVSPETALAPPTSAHPPPARYYLDDGPPEHHGVDLAAIPDAVPKPEPLLPVRNQPYRAFGQLYRPHARPRPHRETGAASWYGRRYHGKPTASGEIYDMFKMTAAHPVLPIPSYARVTRADNGKSVVVRVNDRGPFLRGRVIDLSYAAAAKLNMLQAGSVPVVVEAILTDSPAAPVPPVARQTPRMFFIQIGAFANPAGAGQLLAELQNKLQNDSSPALRDRALIVYDEAAELHRVGVGEYASPDAARPHMKTLCNLGLCGFIAPVP